MQVWGDFMKVVSACLAGCNCRYNGDNYLVPSIKELVDNKEAIAICPEVEGGLLTPREPAERVGNQILTISGKDVTCAYELGALKTLQLCNEVHATEIILKSKSPSCGKSLIYDGKFKNHLIPGNGCTAELLMNHGYDVMDEEEYKKR